jgi:hypothetical protein
MAPAAIKGGHLLVPDQPTERRSPDWTVNGLMTLLDRGVAADDTRDCREFGNRSGAVSWLRSATH